MARSNPLAAQQRELERLLARLEKQYDKEGQADREFSQAVTDIYKLLRAGPKNGGIDYDHACSLFNAAKAKLEEARCKRLQQEEAAKEITPQSHPGLFLSVLGFLVLVMFITWRLLEAEFG